MSDSQTIQPIRGLAAGTTRVLACLALVAATTWADFSLLRVNSLIAGFSYVLVVLVVAAKWGFAESFVELSVRRCQSALTTIWFAGALFLCEVAFGLGWGYKHSVQGQERLGNWLWFSSLRIDIVWMCTVAFFGAMAWYRGKKRAELTSLLKLREEMAAQSAT